MSQPVSKAHVGHARIDTISTAEAASKVLQWSAESKTRVVVTPNIQHIDLLARSTPLRDAYARAELVLPDGWPVALACRIAQKKPVERVTGVDLTVEVLRRAEVEQRSVAFFGGGPGSARLAARACAQRYPALRIAQVEPLEAEELAQPAFAREILDRLAMHRPNIIVLGLGTPKQEIFANSVLRGAEAGVVLCVGATLDFLAGTKQRAPKRFQRVGLEWLWRLAHEPRRLGLRYAGAAIRFPRHLANRAS